MNEFAFSRDVQRSIDLAATPGTTSFAIGMWIRLGLVGISAFIAALVALADSDTPTGMALLLGVSGMALALASWVRVRRAVHEEDNKVPETSNAPETHAVLEH
jgi:hypothetical protein